MNAEVVSADAPGAVARAAERLAAGALVALPTETVYGIAAAATSPAAIARLYGAKGRPARNPLICHVDSVVMAERLGVFDDRARRLVARAWPGPLTVVLRQAVGSPVAAAVTAGGETIALRMPAAPLFRAVVTQLGRPVAAPSANRSGRISATTAQAVLDELGDEVALVIDDGPSPVGLESTVVDLTQPTPRILRPGALDQNTLADALGIRTEEITPAAATEDDGPLAAPGMLASHYAPEARVRLDVAAADVGPDEAYLAFGETDGIPEGVPTVQLSGAGDIAEAARNLYWGLRALDASGRPTIAVAPIPPGGLGTAIRDRLGRAAAPRDADR